MGSWLTSIGFSGAGPARGRSHVLASGTNAGGMLGDEYSERTMPGGTGVARGPAGAVGPAWAAATVATTLGGTVADIGAFCIEDCSASCAVMA
eukprot:15451948-Alexandrium_andersonii.AAC.1